MIKLRFKYNINQDTWAWVRHSRIKNVYGIGDSFRVKHIPKKTLKMIRDVEYAEALKITKKEIKKELKADLNKLVKGKIKILRNNWRRVESEYFNVLTKLLNKTVIKRNLTVYFTTGYMCSYNFKEGWFMVSVHFDTEKMILTCCHEIFHLYFYTYFKQRLLNKGLSNEKIEDIKEAVTVLLNEPEFSNIIKFEDKGYPNHQALRKRIQEFWREGKSFEDVLDIVSDEINRS